MNVHRFSENFLVKGSFNAALTNGAQTGVYIDTQGYRRCALIFDAVTGSATTAKVKVQESATTTSGDFADVTSAAIPTVAQPASTPASGIAGAPYVMDIDLEYRKRYLRPIITGTGTAGQAVVDFVLYQPFNAPVTQDAAAGAVSV